MRGSWAGWPAAGRSRASLEAGRIVRPPVSLVHPPDTLNHPNFRCGMSERQVVLMLADPLACSPRNARPGVLRLAAGAPGGQVPPASALTGDAVSERSLVRLLMGRTTCLGPGSKGPRFVGPGPPASGFLAAPRDWRPAMPCRRLCSFARTHTRAARSPAHTGLTAPGFPAHGKLRTDGATNLLLFLTGHGGDEFLKMHDQTELSAADLATAIEDMHRQRRHVCVGGFFFFRGG